MCGSLLSFDATPVVVAYSVLQRVVQFVTVRSSVLCRVHTAYVGADNVLWIVCCGVL